jgi:hypothetical protein
LRTGRFEQIEHPILAIGRTGHSPARCISSHDGTRRPHARRRSDEQVALNQFSTWGAGGGARRKAIGSGRFRSGALAANGFRGGGFHHHGRRFAFGAFALGLGYPYAYYGDYDYDYPYYDDSYYGDGGCYVVRRRVHTRYGWRIRPVQVCGLIPRSSTDGRR